MDGRTVYTLGTSNRTPAEFLALLGALGAEVVIDVRRFPRSRHRHFNQDQLALLLQRGSIDYVYLGDELGGYRRGGYGAFVATEQFRHGLRRVEALARERTIVLVCAERLPWRCHRRFIGVEMERAGFTVSHIIDEGRSWQPKSAVDQAP